MSSRSSHSAQLSWKQQFGRVARAVEHDQASELVAVVEDFVDQRAGRGQPQAARRDQHIFAHEGFDREAAPERAANADFIAGLAVGAARWSGRPLCGCTARTFRPCGWATTSR